MAPNRRKALFFDVDGTLVDEHGEIPESTIAAIKAARERGHLIFVNSGRTYSLAAVIEKQIAVDGMLCGCGTDLRIFGEQRYSYLLPKEILQKLRADYEGLKIDLFLEGPEGTLIGTKNRLKSSEDMRAFMQTQGGLAPYAFEDESCPVNKFCILSDEASDLPAFFEKYRQWMTIIDRGDGFYECVPNGHGKGEAVRKTIGLLGILPEDTYAFGDSTNDVDMLEAVRHPVIMGFHDKAIEPYAEFVTKTVEDGGIAYAMAHYGLI